MAVNYGQVAIVPKGEWNVETQYKVNNLVSYDGSSYVAKVQPPVGTLPTDTSYWQVSAAGTKKATADSLGTVMPDGTTTSVGEDGKLSVNTAQQNALGVVKGSDDITVGEDGTLAVNTTFEQATELANIIAGEAIKSVLGKVSKAIATTMSLDENALLKNMISGIDVNDSNKVPSSAYIHTLVERIGMGTELVSGLGDLTTGLNTVNNNLSNYANATMHRMIFRGKYLGDKFTDAQKAAIKNGTFDDLFLGDYWNIKGRTWRIVDMDYWYNCGDTAFTSHHLVIMPDEALYNAQMNTTNVTTGGYVGSEMYKKNLENAKTIVNAAFQGSVLTHREYLCNAVANGRPSGGAWFDSSIELPNEPMMYGHLHFSPTSDGSTVPSIYTISKTQLALFMVCPRFIVNRSYNQWLRDVVSSAYFALVYGYGYAAYYNAAGSFGVRPVFPVG